MKIKSLYVAQVKEYKLTNSNTIRIFGTIVLDAPSFLLHTIVNVVIFEVFQLLIN